MGTFSTEIVSSTGTEVDFLKAIYKYIVTDEKIGAGITCSITKWDDAESDYITIDDAESTDIEIIYNKYTTIKFWLDTNVALIFQSYPTNDRVWNGDHNNASNGCNITLIVNEITVLNKTLGQRTWYDAARSLVSCIPFVAPAYTYTDWKYLYPTMNAERKFIFSNYIDDNVFVFWINPYSSESFKDIDGVSIIKFKDNNSTWHWSGYTGPCPIENSTVYDSNGANATTKSSMFSYEAKTGYLDFIPHSSFVSGSTKVFTSTNILDCTAVNIGDTFLLDDNHSYMAIGTHSLVPLDYAITPPLIVKTINANGTYSAKDDGADGYSEVTVDVDGWTSIFENGQWLNPEGVSYTISPTGAEYIYIEDGELVYSETTGVSVAAVDQTKYISLKAEFSIVKAESCFMQTGRCVAGADARRCQNEGYQRYSYHDYNFPAAVTTDRTITIMCNGPRAGVFLSGNSTTDAIRIKRLSVFIQSDLVAFN